MTKLLFVFHTIIAFSVLLFCLVAATDSYLYFGNEPLSFSWERAATALLCGSFAATHLYLLATKHLATTSALLFYPLCLSLGLVTSLVVRASGKNWAPASSSEAAFANVVGFGVIILLVIACVASCYWPNYRRHRLIAHDNKAQ